MSKHFEAKASGGNSNRKVKRWCVIHGIPEAKHWSK